LKEVDFNVKNEKVSEATYWGVRDKMLMFKHQKYTSDIRNNGRDFTEREFILMEEDAWFS